MSAACECGEPEQTEDHVINHCQLHKPPSQAGLFNVGLDTIAWLQGTELTILQYMREELNGQNNLGHSKTTASYYNGANVFVYIYVCIYIYA